MRQLPCGEWVENTDPRAMKQDKFDELFRESTSDMLCHDVIEPYGWTEDSNPTVQLNTGEIDLVQLKLIVTQIEKIAAAFSAKSS